jgi:outer membrane protein OmpA-like peptidoglycan-associated protein
MKVTMPNWTPWLACAVKVATSVTLLLPTGCATPSPYSVYGFPTMAQPENQAPDDRQLARLASAMADDASGTEVMSASPGTCGSPAATLVVHIVIPERVLFATASDQPGPDAAAALESIAGKIRQQAPGAELTVLGHTDAVGSDAYNLDLSKRRALAVLRALVARGLSADRLTAVAIGKRQPIADNGTPEGRTRNRRVEVLASRCLAANLDVVTGVARNPPLAAPDGNTIRPVEVLRLDPAGAYGLTPLGTVTLRLPGPDRSPSVPAQQSNPLKTAAPGQPLAPLPSAGVARPAPAPHFQPRTLSPDVQPNPLGSAVPF